MMRIWWISPLLVVMLLVSLAACQTAAPADPPDQPTALLAAASPTATSQPQPLAAPSATATTFPSPPASATPAPSSTPTGTATPTDTATPTETPTQTATATETATRRPEALPCPAELPVRPDYNRYYLSGEPWPTPDPAGAPAHFWLNKPLPGGGRLLTNQWFPYGYDASRYLLHNGTDVAEDLGTPVLAVAAGTIVVAGADANEWWGWRCDWYGHLVVLQLDETWLDMPVYVLYGHVLNINVEVGQRVSQGEQVAEIGLGGAATVPHLHIEVRVGENAFGSTRNPMLWINPATRGVIAGRLVDPEGRPWQGVGISAQQIGGEGEILNTWSYLGDPLDLINPDEQLAENFVFSDMVPGDYQLFIRVQEVEYTVTVTVTAGEVATVEIVTEPFKTPMPTVAAPTSEP